MPSHSELVAFFQAGLSSGTLPPGLTAREPSEAARRFAVYRNNVAHGLAEALAARFPVIRRLVGGAFFAGLSRAFAAAHPPASPVLLAWGTALPNFLDGFPPVAGLPYLSDVARIEVARGEAFHAADREPLGPEPLAAAAADSGAARLALHPSVRVLVCRHAAASIWAANQPGAALRVSGAAPLDPMRPETALVLRDRRFDVPVRAVEPGDAAVLLAMRDGATLLAAARAGVRAEPGHDPTPLLALLARAGALVAPEPESVP